MKKRMIFAIGLVLGAVLGGTVSPHLYRNALAAEAKPATRIDVDQTNHMIRFFIDGEESVRLSGEGLEVRNNIAYGGTTRDYGEAGFRDQGEVGVPDNGKE